MGTGRARHVLVAAGGTGGHLFPAEALAAALARANADAAANRVVEPYPIEVTRVGVKIVPVKLREKIRADGPTTGHSKDNIPAVKDCAA